MDWGNEIESTTKKQLIPRLGRRAGHNVNQDDGRFEDEILDSPSTGVSSAASGKTIQIPVAPPRTRKTGWSDELKSAKGRTTQILEQGKFRKSNREESIDDIPVIPDAEEFHEENLIEAPSAPSGINRIAAYQELDTDLLKNASFAFLDDVNLSLLTEKLYPEKIVQESDEVWNWESTFIQVSSELNSEAQKKSEA
ncbi:intraflagellar transport protein 43 homolog isoform X2 [Diachasma alloeum]|uniref:intraflagellar transport protein 43 homolog isoform X2 n=1 Tax=Diachasma alloeum TaxID=454923 RepID=UPI0007384B70|nr:intraflagellar transport protein 43 homolog isoform X2 [Diachasma alloeum]